MPPQTRLQRIALKHSNKTQSTNPTGPMQMTAGAPRYSICITNYNMRETIRDSMESILSQIDLSFEVVVCDNCSTDGSNEILTEYANEGRIRLIVERSSRGRGRQIAFENSTGKYIISGLDMDDIIRPTLSHILEIYHQQHDGYMMSIGDGKNPCIHVIPRAIAEEVGGWRDLRCLEDIDFCKRVEAISKLHYLGGFFADSSPLKVRQRVARGLFYRLRECYDTYRAEYKIGLDIFHDVATQPHPWYRRAAIWLIALSAFLISRILGVKKFKYA